MLQRCGILRTPSAARAKQHAARHAQLSSPRVFSPSHTTVLTVARRRRHGGRSLTPLAVMTPPPREAGISQNRRSASSSSSTATAAATTTTPLDDDVLFFNHLEKNNYDVNGILDFHAQRQSFPSTTDGGDDDEDDVNLYATTTTAAAAAAAFGTSPTVDDSFSVRTTSLEDEFPPAPPTMTYEEIVPYVELARLDHRGASSPNENFDATTGVEEKENLSKKRNKFSDGGRRPKHRLALPVLVGWFRCRRSHLRKYAAMYLSPELGYDAVVLVRPPAAATLFPSLGDAFAASALNAMETLQRRLAEEEKEEEATEQDNKAAAAAAAEGEESSSSSCSSSEPEEVEEEELKDRPVLLHLFSNGGYLFAGNVMHAYSGRESDTCATTSGMVSNVLLRNMSLAPKPQAARRFTSNVAALVMDSAPGELEPGMVAASFQAVLQGKAAPPPAATAAASATDDTVEGDGKAAVTESTMSSTGTHAALRQTAAALLVWAPIARRLRFIDAAWGGFPAVTGNRWSGDGNTRPGNAAEVAFAAAANAQAAMTGRANADGSLTAAKIARRLQEEEVPGGPGLLWCPALFLYSQADPIIKSSHVESFASARAMRLGRVASAKTRGRGVGGGMVVMKRWDNAPHCEIGRMDPEGYVRALRDFLKPSSESATTVVNNKKWDRY